MNNKDAFSVLGLFESPQLLMRAIPSVKAKVKGRLEAYTPYPIHGMDEALGKEEVPDVLCKNMWNSPRISNNFYRLFNTINIHPTIGLGEISPAHGGDYPSSKGCQKI